MGTNFYIKGKRGNDDPRYHIGKRSAAGDYCWDCGLTLCKGGEARIHCGDDFYDKCPKCGKGRDDEDFDNSAVGRELGFNNTTPKKKTGVQSCCSFPGPESLVRPNILWTSMVRNIH